MSARLLLAAVAASAFAAVAAAEPATKSVAVGGFSKIDASRGMDVIFTPGAASVTLEGDASKFDRVEAFVKDDTLVVRRKPDGLWMSGWSGQVKVRASAPALSGVKASSGADVRASDVRAGSLSLAASSGADIDVSGTCAMLAAQASSGSDIDARALTCAEANAAASSGAGIQATVTGEVSASASSGGDVTIYGPAKPGAVSESSGGDVTFRP